MTLDAETEVVSRTGVSQRERAVDEKYGIVNVVFLASHGGRRGMGKVLVRAFGYTVAARYLDNSEEMVRERYSHIEAGELGDVATEALEKLDQ